MIDVYVTAYGAERDDSGHVRVFFDFETEGSVHALLEGGTCLVSSDFDRPAIVDAGDRAMLSTMLRGTELAKAVKEIRTVCEREAACFLNEEDLEKENV